MYDFIFTKTFWLIMKPPAYSFEYKKWGAYVRNLGKICVVVFWLNKMVTTNFTYP